MLNNKRIQEAKANITLYLNEGLLKKQTSDISKSIFITNSKDSLRAAKLLFDNNFYLWVIVSSYYSMFYIANAVLLHLGYKVGDKIAHKVTADTLIVKIRPKLKESLIQGYEEIAETALNIAEIKSDSLVESFDFERRKRNTIQYQTTKSDIKSKARTSLQRAQEFLFELESLL